MPKRIAKVTDDTVRSLLDRIRACDVAAVGVLADYMEEHNLPYAKQVRTWWGRYTRNVAFWSNPETDMSRRRKTRWEGIARNRRWLRTNIGVLFGRKWARPPLEKFK